MFFKKKLFVAFAMFSSYGFASPTLILQPEIVPQVLNGKRVLSSDFYAKNSLNLLEGRNQLAITIGQIVSEDGKRRKFDSQPVLMSFTVENDAVLSIKYSKFRTMDEAEKFEANPQFTFKNKDNKDQKYQWVQLNKGGLQGFRDYEREIADYNTKQGNISHNNKGGEVYFSQSNTTEFQNTFLLLTAEQQQAFMQWAMRNLK